MSEVDVMAVAGMIRCPRGCGALVWSKKADKHECPAGVEIPSFMARV